MHKKTEEETVAKVTKIYRDLASAVQKYQIDNSCVGHINNCNIATNYQIGELLKKYLVVLKSCSSNTKCAQADWLPDTNTRLDGSTMTDSWEGVSKLSHHAYLLNDGTTISSHVESDLNSYIYFDANGKKKPNRVGKDLFIITLGARHGNITDPRFTLISPFLVDDQTHYGVCAITSNEAVCDPNICTRTNCSPTAYVLKHKKLPHINW